MAHEGGVDAVPIAQADNGSAEAASAVAFVSVKPQLAVPSASVEAAVEFYKAAFGAVELRRVNHPKRKAEQETPMLLSAELKIGSASSSSLLVICGAQQEDLPTPKAGKGGVVLAVETEDVPAAVSKAVSAGTVLHGKVSEGEGACCGGVSDKLTDPFGHVWVVSSGEENCCLPHNA